MDSLLFLPPKNVNNILHNSKHTSESYSLNYDFVLFLSCLLPPVCHQVFTFGVVPMHACCSSGSKV